MLITDQQYVMTAVEGVILVWGSSTSVDGSVLCVRIATMITLPQTESGFSGQDRRRFGCAWQHSSRDRSASKPFERSECPERFHCVVTLCHAAGRTKLHLTNDQEHHQRVSYISHDEMWRKLQMHKPLLPESTDSSDSRPSLPIKVCRPSLPVKQQACDRLQDGVPNSALQCPNVSDVDVQTVTTVRGTVAS